MGKFICKDWRFIWPLILEFVGLVEMCTNQPGHARFKKNITKVDARLEATALTGA